MDWIVSLQNPHSEPLIPSTSEGDLIWRLRFYRGNQVKMRVLRVGSQPSCWVPYTKGKSADRHTEGTSREHDGHPHAEGRAWSASFPHFPQQGLARWHLDLFWQPPEPWDSKLLLSQPPVCGTLLWWPQPTKPALLQPITSRCPPPQPLAVTNLTSAPVVLLFLECHVSGIT